MNFMFNLLSFLTIKYNIIDIFTLNYAHSLVELASLRSNILGKWKPDLDAVSISS